MNLVRNVRKCTMELQDTVLLAIKLAAGDLTKCSILLSLSRSILQ